MKSDKIAGDNIVEEARQAREGLIKRYGGINGYFRHLQALDRALAARAQTRRARKSRRAATKNRSAK